MVTCADVAKHTSGEIAIILAGGPESFIEGHAH